MTQDLDGTTALVTGSTSGIGQATTETGDDHADLLINNAGVAFSGPSSAAQARRTKEEPR